MAKTEITDAGDAVGQSAGRELTIDGLADATGVPTRTIREYQRLGLLEPPRRDGRVGRYSADHRARLAIIARLQARGYSLAAIGDLISSWKQGQELGSVLGVDAGPAVLDETPTEVTRDQLDAAVPGLTDPERLDQAVDAGLVHVADDGRMMVRSLAALELVGLAAKAGMSTDAAIGIAAAIRCGAAGIAERVINTFVDQLWNPDAGRPDSGRADGGDLDLAPTMTRARLLLAQASASLVVHELGVALYRVADGHRDDSGDDNADARRLHALIDEIAIGAVRTLGDT